VRGRAPLPFREPALENGGTVRDDDLRSSCFASLDVLCAKLGPELPYRGALAEGFAFRGRRVPFLNYQKGIYRAAAQRGAAALSVNTSFDSPYGDAETDDGFRYAYRAGDVDQADNRALREAFRLGVPLVYFVGTRPGVYRPEWPVFVTADDPTARMVTLTPGRMIGPYDERAALLPDDPIERRYAVREARVRLHQARFRARVLPAYANQCTICRLKETRLLDAAHIVGDAESEGEPAVTNGLSLCSIHHRAFDEDLVGVSPDYVVRVHPRLLDEDDGAMLDLLKRADRSPILVPRSPRSRPDRELLAVRFDRFRAA
jgi:putative restriction endonuclease